MDTYEHKNGIFYVDQDIYRLQMVRYTRIGPCSINKRCLVFKLGPCFHIGIIWCSILKSLERIVLNLLFCLFYRTSHILLWDLQKKVWFSLDPGSTCPKYTQFKNLLWCYQPCLCPGNSHLQGSHHTRPRSACWPPRFRPAFWWFTAHASGRTSRFPRPHHPRFDASS